MRRRMIPMRYLLARTYERAGPSAYSESGDIRRSTLADAAGEQMHKGEEAEDRVVESNREHGHADAEDRQRAQDAVGGHEQGIAVATPQIHAAASERFPAALPEAMASLHPVRPSASPARARNHALAAVGPR